MVVWTTPELNSLLLQEDLPVKLKPESKIRQEFLKSSLPSDIAVIPCTMSGSMDFLTAAKARGLHGPFFFVEENPSFISLNLDRFNALHVVVRETGLDEARKAVNFLIRIAMERETEGIPQHGTIVAGSMRKPLFSDGETIRKTLLYPFTRSLPVILSFPLFEEDRPVNTRVICSIRKIGDEELLLHRFTPSSICDALKKGMLLQIILPGSGESYDATVEVLGSGGGEVRTTLPGEVFVERRKTLRVEPSVRQPVRLQVLKDTKASGAVTLDIGERGMVFESPEEFAVGEGYVFALLLPQQQNIILCPGVIRFKRKKDGGIFHYGAELNTLLKDRLAIAQYIMTREQEVRALFSENREK